MERRGEYRSDDRGRAAPRRARGVVCDMGEGARAARGGRNVDSLRMAAVFVVGGALGTERALDAAWVHGSSSTTLSLLEEVAGWANREMVLEAVR